jgi:hypothetical protein
VRFVASRGIRPRAVVEPTCGLGSLLLSAVDAFPAAEQILGAEINGRYLSRLAEAVGERPGAQRIRLQQANFFEMDWRARFADLPEPILVIGNPPWVTSATQGSLESANLPVKANRQGLRGIEALTGRSNFDVSEWMLARLVEALQDRRAVLAMLCKTSVARRVLADAWRRSLAFQAAELHAIDAGASFGAAVAASLFVLEFSGNASCDSAACFSLGSAIGHGAASGRIGWRAGCLVADLEAFTRSQSVCADRSMAGPPAAENGLPVWRSGVKHDCAPVMELVASAAGKRNGLGERVDLEAEHVFPLCKSGEVASGHGAPIQRWLLLPQRHVGDDTGQLQHTAPRTWRYLQRHAARLDARRSSIYRRQPRFAVFGVGEYTFAPWKVAVSGLAKQLRFRVIGPWEGRPVVFDDACYFLPCASESEAVEIAGLLNSPLAADFFGAYIFWDAKRPLTAELLRRLDLARLRRAMWRGYAPPT